jgi:transposase
MAQRIVFLLEDEGLSIDVVAQRCGVGATTIRRIKAEYDSGEHVKTVQSPTVRASRTHYKAGALTVSFPRIESRRGNGNGHHAETES